MTKINYTIKEGGVITSWTELPFDERSPYIEVDDPNSIHVGFDTIENGTLVPHLQEYWDWREAQIAKKGKMTRINELKKLLSDTDYQAIKHSEGLISDTDYAAVKAQRQAWRDEINELEAELAA